MCRRSLGQLNKRTHVHVYARTRVHLWDALISALSHPFECTYVHLDTCTPAHAYACTIVTGATPPSGNCLSFRRGRWTVTSIRSQHRGMKPSLPPTIVAFVSPKGGVGKSTSCLALAASLAFRGERVQIIDFDQTETLWRWYGANANARAIPNLSVEKGPDKDLENFIKDIWDRQSGYVFIDLAGSLTHQMLLMATFAHLTITPSKPSEPDIVEASKLAAQLNAIATKVGKPILHRILLNEVPALLQTHQAHVIDQIDASNLHRFQTIMHTRAAFPETWLTGLPPHFADRSRLPVKKAVAEIDLILDELLAALGVNQERQAA